MKSIIVPKDLEAMDRLDRDENISGDLIELDIDNIYSELQKSGLFAAINNITGSMIDDFEDEHIVDQYQVNALLRSTQLDPIKYPSNIQSTIKQINDLIGEAYQRKTGVFFYF